MTEYLILGVFACSLTACIIADSSILYALFFGYVLFFAYGIRKGHSCKEMLSLTLSGIKTVRNVTITLLLIGTITALWRASGTIGFIIYNALKLITPSIFVLLSFLLCSLVSFLTGTSFGTAATMGVICMTMGNGIGMNPVLLGGAILSGSFFGDRCSPMSSSAFLVCDLTQTNIFHNIRGMLRTGMIPFLISCMVYGIAGLMFAPAASAEYTGPAMAEIFSSHFTLHPVTAIPALVILVFSLFKVPVKKTMTVSICTAFLIAWLIQGETPSALISIMAKGYHPSDTQLSKLLSGGGILSMVRVCAIVCLSSCYAGIFRGTGLLDGVKSHLEKLSGKLTPYGVIILTSVLTAMIACNQTLCAILTHQLCSDLIGDEQKMAIHLENTAIVISPLIPWCIAGAGPIASISAPTAALLAACYLYLLPLWNLFTETRKHRITS